MSRRYGLLIAIILLAAAVIWIDFPTINHSPIQIGSINKNLDTQLGLDLRGGLQVLLEVDLPATTPVTSQQMADARAILGSRANGLGVSEVSFQTAGSRRIVGEFPGLTNTEQVLSVLKQTGQLEFVDFGSAQIPESTVVKTDLGQNGQISPSGTPQTTPAAGTAQPTAAASPTTTIGSATPEATGTAAGTAAAAGAATTPGATAPASTAEPVYHTIMTGDQLSSVNVTQGTVGGYEIAFSLKTQGADIFKNYTTNNVGKYLGIVLDKTVISAPVVQNPITSGSGVIQGNFTYDSANALAVQLRYGSLPIPLKIVESRTVGATLGNDSIRKSLIAGIIGLAVVILFMALYYRLPGVLADLALALYAMTTFAIFKLIPVTLSLPGIAGFVLTIGVAVDANILIFERMKEELRAGRPLHQAIDLAWARAWPSIRDSNISTIITSLILLWFGSAFGASLVQGFALTLFIGVLVSLFTAVVVTRTFLHVVLDNVKFAEHHAMFGA